MVLQRIARRKGKGTVGYGPVEESMEQLGVVCAPVAGEEAFAYHWLGGFERQGRSGGKIVGYMQKICESVDRYVEGFTGFKEGVGILYVGGDACLDLFPVYPLLAEIIVVQRGAGCFFLETVHIDVFGRSVEPTQSTEIGCIVGNLEIDSAHQGALENEIGFMRFVVGTERILGEYALGLCGHVSAILAHYEA